MTSTVPLPGDEALAVSSNGHRPPEAYGPAGRSPWLDIDWREHQSWTIVDGQPVNTIEIGSGPPVIFVHGLSGSWPNWLEQLPVIGAHHRAIAIDLPGFGHSPMPAQRITISGYARLLDGLFSELDVDMAALVGNSMGGFVSAEFAIAFPERVERLTLVSPAGLSTYREPRATRALPAIKRLERLVGGYTGWVASKSATVAKRPLLREATFGLVVAHPRRLPAALVAEQIRGAGKPGFTQALEANLDYDFRHRLPEIACPTLIVWGDRDRVITVRDADIYAELIPGARKVVFPDTGHMSQLERPAAFNALLEDFLAA
jgi:pimeloyl-ACP methyl ester carboxylesterase